MALGLLAGHCIEATLKAYLAEKGLGEDVLKRIGHELEAAWHACAENGLQINLRPPSWLLELNYSHSKFRYRYPPIATNPWVPNPEKFIDTMAFLIDQVRAEMGLAQKHSAIPSRIEDESF